MKLRHVPRVLDIKFLKLFHINDIISYNIVVCLFIMISISTEQTVEAKSWRWDHHRINTHTLITLYVCQFIWMGLTFVITIRLYIGICMTYLALISLQIRHYFVASFFKSVISVCFHITANVIHRIFINSRDRMSKKDE